MDKQPQIDAVSAVVYWCLAAAVLIGWYWLWVRRAKSILTAWATKGGFQILDFKKLSMFSEPFRWWFVNWRQQVVFRVHVRDREGRERFGWVRCGNDWSGVIFSNHTEVRWDEE